MENLQFHRLASHNKNVCKMLKLILYMNPKTRAQYNYLVRLGALGCSVVLLDLIGWSKIDKLVFV